MTVIRRLAPLLALLALGLGPWAAPLPSTQLRALEGDMEPTDEPFAVVWEHDGSVVCSATPLDSALDRFTFSDGARWSATASDGFGLGRGDPTRLTWGIVPDGTPITGFNGEPSAPSDLIAFLDTVIGAGPGGSDLTQRPWFETFEKVFTAWGELTGVRYVYKPEDDGADLATASGSAARPDVRIGGHFIDGQSGANILAYNFFPNNGDMVIDTSNSSFYGNANNDFRGLRNTLSHEHGHGLGIEHVCPTGLDRLMEPLIDLSFDGPQEDDVLAGNRGYGDTLEAPAGNDTSGTAHDLGSLAAGGSVDVTGVSVDGTSDEDFFGFTVAAGLTASVTLTPTGTSYLSGPQNQNGSCSGGTTFDAKRQSDLRIELIAPSSSVLAFADAGGLGEVETLTDVTLDEGAGTYFVRVAGVDDRAQMYQLSVSVAGDPDADVSITKAEGLDPALTGTGLTYRVTVTNAGPGAAMGVEVTETLPSGVSFEATSGCAEDPGGVPTCTLGSIAAGEAVSYEVTVSVDHGTSGPLTNQVDLSVTSPDPTGGDHQASVETAVETVSCSTDRTLDASDTATGSYFVAEGTVTAGSGYQVTSTDDVRFVAGSTIVLGDGFSVDSGGRFVAVTDPLVSCPP